MALLGLFLSAVVTLSSLTATAVASMANYGSAPSNNQVGPSNMAYGGGTANNGYGGSSGGGYGGGGRYSGGGGYGGGGYGGGGLPGWATPGGGNVNVYDYLGITSILPYYSAMYGEMNAFANTGGFGSINTITVPENGFGPGRLSPVFGGYGGLRRR